MGMLFLLTNCLITGYILFTLCRGVPVSLSATYYELGRYGWVFQLVMCLICFCLLPVWLSVSEDYLQWMCFLACGGLLFVAAAPCFKLPLEGAVHYGSATMCGVCVVLWLLCEGLWDVLLWCVFVGGMLSLQMKDKWMWWLECALVFGLLGGLWMMV